MDRETKRQAMPIIHLNNPKDLDFLKIPEEGFSAASDSEKENLIEKRKSISYWRDAWRRFRSNKVAMAALIVFLVIVVFAFVGPLIVPYSYESQYRNSAKLGPMEYSKSEEMERTVLQEADAVFFTETIMGSLLSLSKGDYYIEQNNTTYCFTLEKALEKAMIIYDKDAADILTIGRTKDYKNGEFNTVTPLEYTVGEPSSDATEVEMIKSVFPHVFGTDSSGRDIMSRSMYGTRVSLIIGIIAALIVLVIGAAIGAISGLCGGVVDFVIMRIIDLIISIPSTLMVLLLQVVISDPLQKWFDTSNWGLARAMSDLGAGIVSIFIVFALLYWVSMARIVRGQVLQLKSMEFITAEKVLGAGNKRIITRHLLPNCVGQLVIATCLQIPSAIFMESFLSYLGIGVAAPMASLGSMCSDALSALSLYPYRLLCPAIILSVLVLTLNLIGDGLRDALDPRLKK